MAAHPAPPPLPPGSIRKLRLADGGRARAHLLRLDAEDRRRRFLGTMSDPQVAAYADALFAGSGDTLLGCFLGGRLCALGELRRPPRGPAALAEIAITVERSVQGRGIGTELLRRLVGIARNRFIKRLHVVCLVENVRLQRIARRLGGVLRWADGEVAADLLQPWPDVWSMLGELAADGHAWLSPPHAVPN